MTTWLDKILGAGAFNFKNKDGLVQLYTRYMLDRTQSMFSYAGLPDTIPARYLELYLQTNGNCAITEHDGNLYAFTGGLGGEPDVYYFPTIYTIANPALKFSNNLKIGNECALIRNDTMMSGLLPMFNRYATLMAENDITMRISDINCRIISLITAGTDQAKAAADQYLKNIINGDLSIIADNSFLEGIKVQPYGSSSQTNSLTDLIEYHQYLKAGWFNDLGLNANFNMKRESISRGETALNDDCLIPLVDDMLRCRQEGVDAVNKMFGTSISVSLNSSWQKEHDDVMNAEQESPKKEMNTDDRQ